MRYIGGKAKILPYLESFLFENVTLSSQNNFNFLDLFAGTNVVARHFKSKFQVVTNDNLYLSYILSKGSVTPNVAPSFLKLKQKGIIEPLDYLNSLNGVDGFISRNYASKNGYGRMYFTMANAMKIDAIRLQLDEWFIQSWITQDEFEYLLATLIESVPFVSNITGTYGAYLKHWDKRAFKELILIHPILYDNQQQNTAFNQTAESLTQSIATDICYIDPPYNGRQYTSNYHVLETIARYDNPTIKGLTGIREFTNEQVSDFCKKSKVLNAFEQVIKQVNCKHLIISYSSDGLLSKHQIEQLLKKYGMADTYDFMAIDYNTYKSKIVLRPKVDEYLFYIEKAN